MSGLVGLWHLDGRPADSAELRRMLTAVTHRGPDSMGIWCEGAAGVGVCLRRTTPESWAGSVPLARADGTLVLAADARIDNRNELLATLCEDQARRATDISDDELILRAYDRWGERCPEHLWGDFAFAIWDGRRKRIFAARDHFGVRPFYYHHDRGVCFAFGSEIKALLTLPAVPRRLNEERVADYFTGSFEDRTATFYADIARLPAAHRLIITPEGVRLERYWALDPSRALRLGSDTAYAEGFREIFTEAVRCRLRSPTPAGTLLSGGLDSSSITCTARLLRAGATEPLATFSAVFDDARCDERPYLTKVLGLGGFDPSFVPGDASGPLHDLDGVLDQQDEPFFAPNLFLHWGLFRAASAKGVTVLLDGLDGDLTVSHGIGYLEELARAGRWIALAREVDGLARRFDRPRRAIFRNHILAPLTPAPLLRASRGLRAGTASAPSTGGLDPEFGRRIGIEARIKAHSRPRPRDARGYHFAGLTGGIVPAALEVADRAAAAAGIEPRYPFFDPRVAEYCLALPGDQKLRGGWTRMVMRRGMEGILPPEVQWRGGKADLSSNFIRGLVHGDGVRADEFVLAACRRHPGYLDGVALRQACRRFTGAPRDRDALLLWQAAVFFRWLDRGAITTGRATL